MHNSRQIFVILYSILLYTPSNLFSQLIGFNDQINSSSEITFDNRGSLRVDLNKGITNIEYNQFDLPTVVEFGKDKRVIFHLLI